MFWASGTGFRDSLRSGTLGTNGIATPEPPIDILLGIGYGRWTPGSFKRTPGSFNRTPGSFNRTPGSFKRTPRSF